MNNAACRETVLCTVADHEAFRHSLLTPADHDEIDEAMVAPEPEVERSAPRRRASEVKRVLELLDNLETEHGRNNG